MTVREPVVLTSPGDSPGPWTVMVRAADVDPRLPQSVVIEPESTQTAWMLAHVTLSPPPAVKEPLARLTREGGDLKFAWLVSPNSSLGLNPLLNSIVEVRAGAARRVGQFRAPIQAAPLVLDLNGDKQVVPLPLENCPRTDKVSFEVVSLDGFPAGALFRGGLKSTLATAPPSKAPPPIGGPGLPRPTGVGSPLGMPPGALGTGPAGMGPLGVASVPSPLVVEFPDLPGAEIRVRCIAMGTPPTAKLELWVESVYRDVAGVEFPLSLKELDSRLKDAKKTVPDVQEALADARKAIKRLQEKGEKLQKNKATPKRDRELPETKRLLDTNTAEEAKLQKQIEGAQALLDAAPKLQALISSLDKKAKLRYILFVECGDPDLLLADASESPASN